MNELPTIDPNLLDRPEFAAEAEPRRIGDWMQTFTGRKFWPLDPRAEEVCIEDIAHALAMKCRYTGHCREFYSVAQHSVLVSYMVPTQDALWGLLHDAGEAYLPDVARPIKRDLKGFDEIEARVMAAVCARFGMELEQPQSVSLADYVILGQEKRDLMAPGLSWGPLDNTPKLSAIHGWPWRAAREAFIARFNELTRK
jgi:uncharacterized protein